MAEVKELSVSDLLLLSRPVTGALSLSVSPSNPLDYSQNAGGSPGGTRKRTRSDEKNMERGLSERSPRILGPLDHPTILMGTVDLWPDVSEQRSGCSKNDCMLFVDEGARVCCDVLELDIGMIGRRVTVLAWNFIPSKCSEGLLEIIKWQLAEPPPFRSLSGGGSSEDGFYPLCPSSDYVQSEVRSFSDSRRIGRSELCGQLTSVSPVFDVSCTAKRRPPDVPSEPRPENLIGFLVELLVCDCSECISGMYPSHIHGNDVNPVTVYFCGADAKWRPVFAKLVGSFIHIVGLKRRLVLVDVEPIPMLVSTSKTGMRFHRKEDEVSEGALTRKSTRIKNEFTGQYTGVVTGVYMQGMVVELDEKVWLVFTEQLRNPHSLRVGAIVAVRNAHFILPKFSWSNMLLLGACVKTVLIIKRFSALATQCHFRSRTDSLLAKFVGSLSFIAKFWMLLMVSSFREKFSGILLEKEILGSKSKEGLVQIYAKASFSSHYSQLRHGIFKEFCKHNCCCCGDDPEIGATKLALPVSYIFSHAESMWMHSLGYGQKQAKNIEANKVVAPFSHERILRNRFSRHIISSKDLGMVLLGMLQVSSSSGKLQLVDATGRIDAVVPDFRLHTNDQIMYKVDDFRLIMEGQLFDGSGIDQSRSALCRNIFQHVAMQRKLPLTIYVHFYLRTATYIDSHMQLSASSHEPDISYDRLCGRFHLLFVTHKFPANYNVHVDKTLPSASRLYAEAILTPFILFFLGESKDSLIFGKDKVLNKCLRYNNPHGQLDECWLNKESSVDVARTPFSSKVNGDVDNAGLVLYDMNLDTCPNFSFCHQHDNILDQQQVKTEEFKFPLDVDCYLISNYSKCCSHFRGIFSSGSDWNRNGDSEKSGGEVILLEFKSGSFEKFQVLHIGSYYIIGCDQGTSGCRLDDIKDSCSAKVLMTPKTQFWSLSFSNCPYHCKKPCFSFESVNDPLTDGSLIMNEVPLRYFTKNRLIHEKFRSHLLNRGFFNLYLHLSFNKLKFLRQTLRAVEALKTDQSYTFREGHRYNGGVFTASTSCTSKRECLLVGGNLVSVCGEILDVHCLNAYSVASKSFQVFGSGNKSGLSSLLQGQNGICIHVSEGHRTVKIRGTLDVHACPSGMGPGTIATFYRVLSSSSKGHVMVLTPATFIVVNVIKEVHYHDGGRFLMLRIKDDVSLPGWSKTSSSLMFKTFHCFQSSPIQLRGQVVAVHVMVLEKCLRKHKKSCSWRNKKIPSVSIPLAGFIFDDGSLSCCCWAATENAAALLRLNKAASEVFVAKNSRKLCENRRPLHTVGDTLGKLIEKHRQIVIRSTCAAVSDDLSCLDFSCFSCLNKALSTSDQDLIKFIILNACSGPTTCVIGRVMGSDNVELIQSYMDMSTKVYPAHNFWVEEVSHVDALAEARNILHELTC
ncbi:unnamed protein product [Victoria cruziana]